MQVIPSVPPPVSWQPQKTAVLFSAIFATGTDTDIPFANQYALDFAMNKAVAGNNKKLIQKINELKSQPIVDTKRFQQRAEILANLGGIRQAAALTVWFGIS